MDISAINIKLAKIFRTATYLILLFYISQLIWPYIKLPFSNPLDIHGTSPSLQYNPLTNSLRYLMMLIVVLGGYFVTQLLPEKIVKIGMRILFIAILIWGYFLTALVHPDSQYLLNMFHDGEQLGNAALYLQGRGIYDGIVFYHGAFTDPLIAVYSFILFGKSVGSFLLLTSLLRLLAFTLFFILLFFVIKKDLIFYIASLWFYNFISASVDFQLTNFAVSTIRDIPVWIVLLLLWFYLRKSTHPRILLFCIGLLSGFEYFVSIDRAYYLTLMIIFFAIFLLIIQRTKDQMDTWYIPHIKQLKRTIVHNTTFVVFLIGGFVIGFFAQLPLIGIESFITFLKFTFGIFPKIVGLYSEHQFPSLAVSPDNWFPIFFLLLTGVYCIHRYIVRFRNAKSVKFSARDVYLLVIFVFSIVFFRSAIIRSDQYHMVYGSVLIFLTIFLILDMRLSDRNLLKSFQNALFNYTFAIVIIVVLLGYNLPDKTLGIELGIHKPYYGRRLDCFLDYQKDWETGYNSPLQYYLLNHIQCPPYRSVGDIKAFFNMNQQPDTHWLRPMEVQVVKFLNENTTPDDYVFVFNNEASYYYFLKGKSPTKFSQISMADNNFYRHELLQDLQTNPPKYILYSTSGMAEVIEGVPMTERFPDIVSWIGENYPKRIAIQSAIILSKEE